MLFRSKVEAHLLDYRGDLYDRWMEIDFLARLRSVVKFASVEDLLSEMQRDVAATRAAAREFGVQDRVRIT